MSAVFFLFVSLLSHLSISQPVLEIPIGKGTSCKGESGSLGQWGLSNKQISYDLNSLYDSNGFLAPEKGLNANKSLRMSICGPMTPESTSCGQTEEQWCFEEVNMDGTCIAGIANWEESTVTGTEIEYIALFDSMDISQESALGVRVSVLDFGQYNISCLNQHSIVNYMILCASDTNWTHLSFSQNKTNCDWNVTLMSQYGCFDIIDWNSSDSGNSLSGLSVGSVFLIVFVVVMLTYCILGCAYNSFYHGRVGMDAVPNKDTWTQFGRYSRAGCETTRDTVCCSSTSGSYQEL